MQFCFREEGTNVIAGSTRNLIEGMPDRRPA